MTVQKINYGQVPNDGTGDKLRDAFKKTDDNFTDLDTRKANAQDVVNALAFKADVTYVNTELAKKANLASPALTGTPTAPTASAATNTTQLATTAFVQAVKAADTGSAATAVALKTARTINGVSFNGTANITINAVDATSRIASSEKGAANGVATLDATGKVPAVQLPSYVDDVLEFVNLASFPATGETGKIYVALDTNKTYRWSGSAYVYITSGAVDSVAGKTGVVTLVKADVGLSNVDNTADSAKPVSTAQQTALNLKADLASPALTGTPTAPTAATATNTTQLATTAFVQAVKAADTGSSATALTLKTARTINGTSFNGSANITTANWGTARNITIGSTAKAINGSADVSWTVAEIGAEPELAAGTTAQYYRGDKTWQTLDKSAVGLSNVDNTADSAKPVSTAQQTALNLKADLASPALTGTPTAPTAADGTSSTQLATTAFVQGAVGGYLSKTTTGGTITLTAAEASNPIIKVSGALTSNALLEIPVASKRNYSIENATTGAFTLTVKHVGLTPSVLVAQGKRNIVMTNGVGAYDAINDFESIALTGVPTAPTAGSTTNTTQVATTAFVQAVNASDTGSAATAVALKTARLIGGVSFNGTADITLPGVNAAGNQNTTGSAATLTTARTINGTSFNGSANITTANWGTARNLTVGRTTKSVNGSDNVAWSNNEIGSIGSLQPSFRNMIINGAIEVAQRGNAPTPVIGTTYVVDRWMVFSAGAAPTSNGVGGGHGGFPRNLVARGRSGNTAISFAQRIESLNCSHVSGKKITVSVWLYSSVAKTPSWTITSANAADNFGATTAVASGSFTALAAGVASYQTFTFTANAACVRGMELSIAFGATGDGIDVGITGVQMELGEVATDFEHLPYGVELSLCQRYYFSGGSVMAGMYISIASYRNSTLVLPVTMRATPTFSTTGSLGSLYSAASTTNTVSATYQGIADMDALSITFSNISAEL